VCVCVRLIVCDLETSRTMLPRSDLGYCDTETKHQAQNVLSENDIEERNLKVLGSLDI
jgi:hypothetical protein